MVGRSQQRPRGGLERDVVACLAAADGPLTAAEVQAEVGADLTYSTVLTTLIRLYRKQALTRSPRGRANAYALIRPQDDTEAGLVARQMLLTLDGGADRARVLSRFVAGLDNEALTLLSQVISGLTEKQSADDIMVAAPALTAG